MRTLRDTTIERIRELRKQRGISQQGLADRLRHLGTAIDRTTIAKIEKGTRELTLIEAFQFAQALDVAPVHLFVPTDPERDEQIDLAPNLSASPSELRAWIRGQLPLFQDARRYFSVVPEHEFNAAAASMWESSAGIVVKTSDDAHRQQPPNRKDGQ